MERVSVKDAAKELSIDQETLRYMMQAEKLHIAGREKRDGTT